MPHERVAHVWLCGWLLYLLDDSVLSEVVVLFDVS